MYWEKVVKNHLPGVKILVENWEEKTVSLNAKSGKVVITQACLRAFGENATMRITGDRFIYKDPTDDRGDEDYPYIEILVEHVDFPKRP